MRGAAVLCCVIALVAVDDAVAEGSKLAGSVIVVAETGRHADSVGHGVNLEHGP